MYRFTKWHKKFINVSLDTWFWVPEYTILRCPLNFVWEIYEAKACFVAPATLGL